MCSSYLLISSLFRRQTVNDLSRIPADFCTVTCSLTHILTYAGLVLRTCQHSFCHANFELRPKSVNSCFLRIHVSAMLFCTSDLPWNFREASARIHFPLFPHCFLRIQCSVELPGGICQHSFYHILHRLSRNMSGDERPGEMRLAGMET